MATEDTILSNAMQPKRAKSAGVEVEQHSVRDQIAAANHKAAVAATTTDDLPLRLFKLSPPGGG